VKKSHGIHSSFFHLVVLPVVVLQMYLSMEVIYFVTEAHMNYYT